MAGFKTPPPLKTHEREFAEGMTKMVDIMSRIYRNQVLGGLQVKTVNKFADAQMGNYASVFLGLSKSVSRDLKKRFSDKRLEEFAKEMLGKTDDYNKKRFYAEAEKVMAINVTQAVAKEGLNSSKNALVLETAQWAKKLRDETLEAYTANSLKAMSTGKTMEEILSGFGDLESKRKNSARLTARTQVANYNSMVTKLRAQKLGIQEATWVTSQDERVRRCHQVRNGKKFALSEGLYSSCDGKTLFPGSDINCRCTYTMVIPEADNGQ